MTDTYLASTAPTLKGRLIAAFLVVAGLIVADYVLEYSKSATVDNSAHAINLSGRQRMLSQRIAVLSETHLRYISEGTEAIEDNSDAESVRADLHAAIERMAREHGKLTEGDPSRKVRPPTGELARHYFGGAPSLDQQVGRFLDQARRIAAADQVTPQVESLLKNVLDDARRPLLEQLDKAVSLREDAAVAAADELSSLGTALFLVKLAGLLAVFLLFVRPTFRLVEAKFREVAETNAILEREARRREEVLWGTSAGTWEWNVQTGETVFNERWAEIIGYRLEELEPVSIETWLSFAHPDDLKVSGERLEAHFAGETDHYECEARMRHKDGHWVWVLDRGKVVEWTEDGKPLRISGTHAEITKRKEAEEVLSQQAEELRDLAQTEAQQRAKAIRAEQILLTAIDAIDDGFVLYDREDRLVLCNERYREMYPKSQHAMVAGAKFEEILRAGLHRGEYAEAVGREEEWLQERLAAHARVAPVAHQLADGRWLRVTERRTFDGGRVGLRVDITDLVEARGAAERAAKAKSEFLASMSHEIRTPMTSIVGFADLLLATEIGGRERSYVEKIKDSTNWLLSIINDILDLSKIEAGKMEILNEPFSPSDLVQEVTEFFEGGLSNERRSQLEVGCSFDAGLPRRIVSDPSRFRQVLVNLLGNAIKFTACGRIEVRCQAVDDAVLRVEVSDTGIGIAPDVAERLFQSFEQGDASVTRQFEGTGLGLAICKRLTTAMGGDIGVESDVGEGSCFWFELPLIEAEDAVGDGASPAHLLGDDEALGTGPLRVLIAEDNAVNQIVVTQILAALGHTAEVVSSGREAIDLLETEDAEFDVVLMDVRMPGMSGLDATRIIRKSEGNLSDIPIVALTADVLPEQVAECFEAGMSAYVSKPIDVAQLATTLAGVGRTSAL